ncbi:lipoprotein [Mycoplasma capricolum]|uniref:lipoprotein n=1 Tax=Mycoplasma capricolum TaxID=2095 RepID=UPI003DA4D741
MKKLLTIFGSISLISMTSITSIACKNINKSKKEEQSSKEKDKNKQGDNNKETKENSEQADQPKRTKEENFGLIKKYGAEVLGLLESLKDKIDQLYKKPENSELLKLATNIGQLYQKLGSLTTIDEFEKKFKSEYEKNKDLSKSFDEFANDLFKQWDKAVTEYEKEKDNILKILKQ